MHALLARRSSWVLLSIAVLQVVSLRPCSQPLQSRRIRYTLTRKVKAYEYREGTKGALTSSLKSYEQCGLSLKVNMSCPRVLHAVREVRAGLGHQLSELVFFAQLSKYYGATLVIEPFSSKLSSHGSSHLFVNSFLGLQNILSDLDVRSLKLNSTLLSDVSNEECGVLFEGGFRDCPGADCFQTPLMRSVFANFAPCLRYLSTRDGTWRDNNPYKDHTFNVVWHVRVGDRVPHDIHDVYFQNIYAGMRSIFDLAPVVHHYVLGDWFSTGAHKRQAFKSKFTELLGSDNVHFPRLSLKETLTYMLHASVLIGSGSSLSAIVPLFSDKPMYLNVKPKHGWNFLAEDAFDGVQVTGDGHVVTPTWEMRSIMRNKRLD